VPEIVVPPGRRARAQRFGLWSTQRGADDTLGSKALCVVGGGRLGSRTALRAVRPVTKLSPRTRTVVAGDATPPFPGAAISTGSEFNSASLHFSDPCPKRSVVNRPQPQGRDSWRLLDNTQSPLGKHSGDRVRYQSCGKWSQWSRLYGPDALADQVGVNIRAARDIRFAAL
jgi:hypothetical protein